MNFLEYQGLANETAIYKDKVIYPTLGLASEAGEVAGKVKKILRDKEGKFSHEDREALGKEVADCLWYCAAIATDLGLSLDEIAVGNINKLKSRQQRGVLGGSGDSR